MKKKKKADDLWQVFVGPSLYVFAICTLIVLIIILAAYFGER
jgi:hypothetical protein